jgi:hypothetical protein
MKPPHGELRTVPSRSSSYTRGQHEEERSQAATQKITLITNERNAEISEYILSHTHKKTKRCYKLFNRRWGGRGSECIDKVIVPHKRQENEG